MGSRELNESVARTFSVQKAADIRKTINRAVRTLPGGNETLDAIESLNAARNHASRHRANDRVIAIDAAIDWVEEIRSAMSAYVLKKSGGGE